MANTKFSIFCGPQFRGGKTAYLFFVMLALIILAAYAALEGDWWMGVIGWFLALLLVFFTFDFQGVDFDRGDNRVRRYRIRPWGKEGQWEPLSDFTTVQLGRENYMVKAAQIYSHLIGNGPRTGHERHSQFIVCVTSKHGKHIVLKETEDIRAALKVARMVAQKLNIPLKDHVKEALMAQRRGLRH